MNRVQVPTSLLVCSLTPETSYFSEPMSLTAQDFLFYRLVERVFLGVGVGWLFLCLFLINSYSENDK